ncbi:MAG: hypothetical protein Q4A52_07690 [Bacillota bacterium]|nr:hypothetical protein [Bacillota bacterium]
MKNKMTIGIAVLALVLLAGVYWWAGRDVTTAPPIDRPEASSGQSSAPTTEAQSTTSPSSLGTEYRVSLESNDVAPKGLGRVVEENGKFYELSMEHKSFSAYAPGQATIVYQEIDRKPSDQAVAEILWVEMDHPFQLKEADIIENPKEITYRFNGRIYRGDLKPVQGEKPKEENLKYYVKYSGRLFLTDLPAETETTPMLGRE